MRVRRKRNRAATPRNEEQHPLVNPLFAPLCNTKDLTIKGRFYDILDEERALDEGWWRPGGGKTQKQNRGGSASDQQRVEMVRKSIADNPHFRLSTEEMHPDGYTGYFFKQKTAYEITV